MSVKGGINRLNSEIDGRSPRANSNSKDMSRVMKECHSRASDHSSSFKMKSSQNGMQSIVSLANQKYKDEPVSALLSPSKEKLNSILRMSPRSKKMNKQNTITKQHEQDRDVNTSKVLFDIKKNMKEMSKENRLYEKLKYFHLEDEKMQEDRRII